MGSLAGIDQKNEVYNQVKLLKKSQEIIFGSLEDFDVVDADKNKGAFMSPILFLNEYPFKKTDCHNIEAFGPVSTIMPYSNIEEAIKLARMGKGSLVCSIITSNMKIAEKFNMPVICLIDTPGAYPGLEAEERGQAEAIAKNIQEM